MAEEAVKQEGDFSLKGKIKPKSKKLKQLEIADKEIAKIDLGKKQTQVTQEVPKMDLTKKQEDAVQEQKTKSVSMGESPGDSKKVDAEIRVSDTDDKQDSPIEVIEEITDSVEPQKEIKEKPQLLETPKLPENVEKLVTFMNETGGTVEDYVELNKDYSKLDNDQLLREYLRKTKPHLDSEDVDLIMEDYNFDEDLDEKKDIRRKKLAYKEAVANAKIDLENKKSKYYAEIKQRPGVTQDQQKALDFFNRYNKQQETIKQTQDNFKKGTSELFATEFKGFDYTVGDKKFRYKVQDPNKVAQTQSNIENFVNKFLDEKGNIGDMARS